MASRTPLAEVDDTAPNPSSHGMHPSTPSLPIDLWLIVGVVLVGAMSLLTLAEATADDISGNPRYYVVRQGIFYALGIVLIIGIVRFDYTHMRQWAWRLWGILIVGILSVLALAPVSRGTQRAIPTPLFDIQVSEIGKVLLCVVLAGLAAEHAREVRSWRTTGILVGAAALPGGLVLLQDLGSGLVYMAIAAMILFIAGAPRSHIAALGGALVVMILTITVAAPMVGINPLKPYQVARLTSFLHPSNDPKSDGYQQTQSRTAIGSGGKTGRGEDATQVKLKFLPEDHTDFAFASLGELRGFTGAGLLLSLYALIIWRALRILSVARDLFGALVAAGIVAMLLFQVFENVGMNVGIMPITGIPLPLFSYGGSSVISTLMAIGLLQSIHARGWASARSRNRRGGGGR